MKTWLKGNLQMHRWKGLILRRCHFSPNLSINVMQFQLKFMQIFHGMWPADLKIHMEKQRIKNSLYRGFPGGAVVESLPADAGDTGSSPGLGGSHMPRSGWVREPQLLSLRVWSLCSAAGEAATVRGPRTAMKSGPHSPQLEKALAQKRRLNTVINK